MAVVRLRFKLRLNDIVGRRQAIGRTGPGKVSEQWAVVQR